MLSKQLYPAFARKAGRFQDQPGKLVFPVATLLITMALFMPGCKSLKAPAIMLSHPQRIDLIIDSYVDRGLHPFIYVRLEDKNGMVIYEHSKVNSDLHPGLNVDGNTWMRIWSMSKIVTISTALDLVEEGMLNLNDPVTDYIPEFEGLKVAESPDGIPLVMLDDKSSACPIQLVPMDSVMTVLDLINHKAGFYYATTGIRCLDSMLNEKNLPTALNSRELIKRMASLPIIQQPGTVDFYGTNTTVLGLVAERASGKTLKQLVEERITGPLGIEGLQYGLPSGVELIPSASGKDGLLRMVYPGELDIFGPDVPDYEQDHELYLGGEGMLATANGYCDFLRMLLSYGALDGIRVLEEATVKDIYSPHTQLDNPYGHNGYNLWVSSDSMRVQGTGDAGLWIGAGYEGTLFWVDPKRDFVGVIMTQAGFLSPEAYGRDDAIRREIYSQIFESEKNDN